MRWCSLYSAHIKLFLSVICTVQYTVLYCMYCTFFKAPFFHFVCLQLSLQLWMISGLLRLYVCTWHCMQSGNGGGSALCSQVAAALSASLGPAGKPLSWLGRVAISYGSNLITNTEQLRKVWENITCTNIIRMMATVKKLFFSGF